MSVGSPVCSPPRPTPGLDGASLVVRPAPTPVPRGLVILLHGAGSGTDTPVLGALASRLLDEGVSVAALEMPYRVAGKRPPDRPARLDAVLLSAVARLTSAPAPVAPARPLALAGASMGSRVACRCARAVGAVGVLALGFPLSPPRDRPSRAGELAAAGVDVLVVQGERDAFGRPAPDPAAGRAVHVVGGADHSFGVRKMDGRSAGDVVAEAATVGADWLLAHLSKFTTDED
ncbi:MAG: alpha/beta family hydrolase [Frankia sp.]